MCHLLVLDLSEQQHAFWSSYAALVISFQRCEACKLGGFRNIGPTSSKAYRQAHLLLDKCVPHRDPRMYPHSLHSRVHRIGSFELVYQSVSPLCCRLTYFKNLCRHSGTVVKVTLPTGQVRAVNHYCTTVNGTGPANPTLWFEGSSAHGVVDFLGLQTILAQRFNRRSCSYDPPNFGWSDRLPASLRDYESYFNPLLGELGLATEPKIVVGWGDGARYALMHALENPNTTTDLVIMDASPDGIEWLDAQRANGWDQKQMLEYRQQDLQGRISLCRLILGIAIPWYVFCKYLKVD